MTAVPPAAADPGTAPVVAVPVRHPWRWVSGALIVFVAVWLAWSAYRSEFVDLSVVRRFQFNRTVVEGLRNTLVLAVAAQAIGIALGVVFAVMRLSGNPVVSVTSRLYVWFFRGTPVLVQLFFWFFGVPQAFRTITLAVPFTDWTIWSARTVDVITPFTAALIGLGLNEGAYMAEIVRAGIISVDEGQIEAAQALGMRSRVTMRRIVLPQAMRVIIPPTGNEFVSMLKTTSLAATILYAELLRRAQDIYSTNLAVIELLVVISLWYLLLTSVASVGQYYLERRFARGTARALPETPLQRVRRNLRLRIRPGDRP